MIHALLIFFGWIFFPIALYVLVKAGIFVLGILVFFPGEMIGYDLIMKYTVTDNVHDTFLIAEDVFTMKDPFFAESITWSVETRS